MSLVIWYPYAGWIFMMCMYVHNISGFAYTRLVRFRLFLKIEPLVTGPEPNCVFCDSNVPIGVCTKDLTSSFKYNRSDYNVWFYLFKLDCCEQGGNIVYLFRCCLTDTSINSFSQCVISDCNVPIGLCTKDLHHKFNTTEVITMFDSTY
jgi:hypothetical protein